MIDIDYDGSSELKFTLDVSGHPGPIDEIRLVMDKGNKKVCYNGILNDNIVTVQLDNLSEVFKPGEHDYSLEIIIGNQYFKPIIDKINLKESVKISSAVLEAKSTEVANTIQVTKVETKKDVEVVKKKSPIREAVKSAKKVVVKEEEVVKKDPTKVSKFLSEV